MKDLAAGNVACLQPSAENQIIDLNGDERIRVIDIVTTLESILSIKAKTRMGDQRPGQFAGRFINSERSRRLLGWKPRFSYRQAMEKYVIWFKQNDA